MEDNLPIVPWHRLFGLFLTDFFAGSPFEVELEKDLSLQQQLLDVVVVRKHEGHVERPLPEGFETLTTHNLVTFKSHEETLDPWALEELIGHYVPYRKQISSREKLHPADDLRLFAVSARLPKKLLKSQKHRETARGVYDVEWCLQPIRIIAASRLPRRKRNALLHLFSGKPKLVEYGAKHFERTLENVSGLVDLLFEHYEVEGVNMPYTMEDFQRDYVRSRLDRLTPKERLEGLAPQERLEGLAPQERLDGLAPQERLDGLTPEEMNLLAKLIEERRKAAGETH